MPAHPKEVLVGKTANRLTTMTKKPCIARTVAMVALMPCTMFCGTVVAAPAEARSSHQSETTSKFYCNISALTPAERAHHTLLSAKLMGARKQIVETPKSYEFQFSPSDVTLAELAEWVANEAKCCPFFDFHIDLENKATLLCLRLTGEEGIKPFIRSEFHIPAS
jgi:hypothetical protein